MNLLRKFKYAIFLSSYFAALVLTKKGQCSTMTLLCKVKCTFLLKLKLHFVCVREEENAPSKLPTKLHFSLGENVVEALVRKYTSNSLADLMVFPIIYINFFLSFG